MITALRFLGQRRREKSFLNGCSLLAMNRGLWFHSGAKDSKPESRGIGDDEKNSHSGCIFGTDEWVFFCVGRSKYC